jgi:uncharacterized membrane protein YgcG
MKSALLYHEISDVFQYFNRMIDQWINVLPMCANVTQQVSISLVPVDFRVVVELHLPRSNLGPLEAGLLAGLLSHIWNTDKQYSDGEASVSRPASASPQSYDDISGNNGSMSRSSNSGGMSLKVLCLAGNPLGPVGTTCLARAVAGLPLRYPFTGGGGYSGGGVFNPRGGSAAIPGNMRAGKLLL